MSMSRVSRESSFHEGVTEHTVSTGRLHHVGDEPGADGGSRLRASQHVVHLLPIVILGHTLSFLSWRAYGKFGLLESASSSARRVCTSGGDQGLSGVSHDGGDPSGAASSKSEKEQKAKDGGAFTWQSGKQRS